MLSRVKIIKTQVDIFKCKLCCQNYDNYETANKCCEEILKMNIVEYKLSKIILSDYQYKIYGRVCLFIEKVGKSIWFEIHSKLHEEYPYNVIHFDMFNIKETMDKVNIFLNNTELIYIQRYMRAEFSVSKEEYIKYLNDGSLSIIFKIDNKEIDYYKPYEG